MEWLWSTECAGCGEVGLGLLCPVCRAVDARRVPLKLDAVSGVLALCRYDEVLGHVIMRAKVRHDAALAEHLARLYARRVAPWVADAGFAALVPAPSTRWTLFTRGFSMAALLAVALSQETGVPIRHVLSRGGVARQATLDRAARKRNLAGRLRSRPCPQGRVLLVDDVVTTGATASACGAALRAAGADDVWLAAMCVVLDPPRPPALPPLPPRPLP